MDLTNLDDAIHTNTHIHTHTHTLTHTQSPFGCMQRLRVTID